MGKQEFEAVLRPTKVWNREEALHNPSPVSPVSGIYAWYFREIPPFVPTDGCVTYQDLTMLYVGIAPSRTKSKSNLRKWIRQHYGGNASGSTLRRTLGCLLADELGIELRRASEKRETFGNGEAVLSEWMGQNAFVVWQESPQPWLDESDLITTVLLPLNLEYNQTHPFYTRLSDIRKLAHSRAKELPIRGRE